MLGGNTYRERKEKSKAIILGFLISFWLLGVFATSFEDIVEVFIICLLGSMTAYGLVNA